MAVRTQPEPEAGEYLSIEQGAILAFEMFISRELTNRRAAELLGRDVTPETARRDKRWAGRKLEQLSRVLPIYFDTDSHCWRWCDKKAKISTNP